MICHMINGYFADGTESNPEGVAAAGTARGGNMNSEWQSIELAPNYTDEELRIRDRLWCRSYAPVLACGALFWGLVWRLA
jgi:hypothetical protein